MFARKVLFARFAVSAFSLAICNSAVRAATWWASSRVRCSKLRTRTKYADQSASRRHAATLALNHHVAHQGGKILMLSSFPSSFHRPGLLLPCTSNRFLPGERLV